MTTKTLSHTPAAIGLLLSPVGLKVLGVVTWPWLWVMSPLLGSALFIVGVRIMGRLVLHVAANVLCWISDARAQTP